MWALHKWHNFRHWAVKCHFLCLCVHSGVVVNEFCGVFSSFLVWPLTQPHQSTRIVPSWRPHRYVKHRPVWKQHAAVNLNIVKHALLHWVWHRQWRECFADGCGSYKVCGGPWCPWKSWNAKMGCFQELKGMLRETLIGITDLSHVAFGICCKHDQGSAWCAPSPHA